MEQSNPKLQTFYADKDGKVVIVCPACGLSKETNVFKANIVRKKIKGRCKCKHVFEFTTEIRTIYRKEVNLTGQLEHLKTHKRAVVQIKDISMDGIGFKYPNPLDLSIGDRLKIAFRLDNKLQSKVNLRVEVKRIDGSFIGAQFIGPWHEPTLGFYLRN